MQCFDEFIVGVEYPYGDGFVAVIYIYYVVFCKFVIFN